MSMSSNLLSRAIGLYREGKEEEANNLLKTVLRLDPTNQIAWNWYIETLSDPKDRISALKEYLSIYPDSPQAIKMLASLEQLSTADYSVSTKPELPFGQVVPIQPTLKSAATTRESVRPSPVSQAPSPRTYGVSPVIFSIVSLSAFLAFSFVVIMALYAYKAEENNSLIRGHYNILQTSFSSLQAVHEETVKEIARLEARLEELRVDYSFLPTIYKGLTKAHLDREAGLIIPELDYDTLDTEFRSLLEDYGNLQGQYSALNSEYDALSIGYDSLVAKHSYLYGWYEWLQTNDVKPPYTALHNRQVTFGFYNPDNSVITWRKGVTELEQAFISAEKLRNNPTIISLQVNDKTVDGYDLRPYVDPNAFENFIPDFYENAKNEAQFIKNVWNIVSQLADSSSTIFENPRHPLETILFGEGDSADKSILFASLLLAAPVDWNIELVLMDENNPSDAQEINHVIVYIDTGRKIYRMESTGTAEKLWPEDTEGWYLDLSQ